MSGKPGGNSMKKRIVKKFFIMIITLLVVSFLVFFALFIIPGDAATNMLGTQATAEKIEALREEMGLNDSFFVQYFRWLFSCIQGDFGTSYSYHMNVSDLIVDKLPITLTLTGMSFVLIVLFSIPIGIFVAKHNGGILDRVFTIVNQILMSIPPFFSGIIITLIFGLILGMFTPGGFISYKTSVPGFLGYLIFPAIAIAIPKIAMTVKLLKESIIEEYNKEYVRTAYSRGNSTTQVLYKHILRNAIIPVITFLGMTLADIVAGSIVVEQVFGIPGLGRILLSSISNRDYPVVQAIIIMLAAIILVINFAVDIIYHKVDPRIDAE